MARVLVVDDDPAVLTVVARILRGNQNEVVAVGDAETALANLEWDTFDVMVTDVQMPNVSGIDLLRAVRHYDLDLPVIFVTGGPSMEAASAAVKYGAFNYITKPIDTKLLRDEVRRAAALHGIARARREAGMDEDQLPSDHAGFEASFNRALHDIWIAYQPIINHTDRTVFGYEALARSTNHALPNIGALIEAAERLGRLQDLGNVLRGKTTAADKLPGKASLFVNLHPEDLMDDDLFRDDTPLAACADRVVLEITERATLDQVKDLRGRVQDLRLLGYRVAVDDLGAGYAGLSSFANLQPDIVKVDMSLVRDIDRDDVKQKVVRAIATVCDDLGIDVIAEGIETLAESETVQHLGCKYLQGYLFARPAPPFPAVEWEETIEPRLRSVGHG